MIETSDSLQNLFADPHQHQIFGDGLIAIRALAQQHVRVLVHGLLYERLDIEKVAQRGVFGDGALHFRIEAAGIRLLDWED